MKEINDIEKNHKIFLQKIVENNVVWYLQQDEGAAMCPSNNSDRNVYLFWGAKSAALKCACHEWQDAQPQKIKLTEFIEVWCIPLYEDEVLMGTNWDTELEGKENHPLVLLKEVINEVRRQNKEDKLNLLLFDDLCDIEQAVTEVLD